MFESVDSLNNNVLSFKDFDRFFRRNGLLIYEDELVFHNVIISSDFFSE